MSQDTVRKTLALVATLVIIVAIVLAGFSDRTNKPMLINGDSLGQDAGESFADYHQRASETLTQATGDSWALVTFATPLRPEEAGRLLDDVTVRRASTLVFENHKPIPLPEPVAPESRSEVCARWALGEQEIVAVVVYDAAAELQRISADPRIAAVEVLPSDAAYGRFGIRPVNVAASGRG